VDRELAFLVEGLKLSSRPGRTSLDPRLGYLLWPSSSPVAVVVVVVVVVVVDDDEEAFMAGEMEEADAADGVDVLGEAAFDALFFFLSAASALAFGLVAGVPVLAEEAWVAKLQERGMGEGVRKRKTRVEP